MLFFKTHDILLSVFIAELYGKYRSKESLILEYEKKFKQCFIENDPQGYENSQDLSKINNPAKFKSLPISVDIIWENFLVNRRSIYYKKNFTFL